MLLRAKPCPNCGCEDCRKFFRDFNEEDTTDLGSSIDEIAGDSEIEDNTLRIPGNGEVKLNLTVPSRYKITCMMDFKGDTAVTRIKVNWTDADTYVFVEFDPQSASDVRMRLWGRFDPGSGPVETPMTPEISVNWGGLTTPREVTVCYQDGSFGGALLAATADSADGVRTRIATIPGTIPVTSGGEIRFSSENSAAIYFDDIAVDQVGGACPQCTQSVECSACDPAVAPENMEFELSGFSGVLAAINGSYALPYRHCSDFTLEPCIQGATGFIPQSDPCFSMGGYGPLEGETGSGACPDGTFPLQDDIVTVDVEYVAYYDVLGVEVCASGSNDTLIGAYIYLYGGFTRVRLVLIFSPGFWVIFDGESGTFVCNDVNQEIPFLCWGVVSSPTCSVSDVTNSVFSVATVTVRSLS